MHQFDLISLVWSFGIFSHEPKIIENRQVPQILNGNKVVQSPKKLNLEKINFIYFGKATKSPNFILHNLVKLEYMNY